MSIHKIVTGVLLLLATTAGNLQAQDRELTHIKQNYIKLLVNEGNRQKQLNQVLALLPREETASDQMVVELFQRQTSPQNAIKKYLTEQKDDGTGNEDHTDVSESF